MSAEWAEADGLLTFQGKVYIPDAHDLRQQIMAQHHDSQVTGHPGRWKTLELVSQNYWWPHMSWCKRVDLLSTCVLHAEFEPLWYSDAT